MLSHLSFGNLSHFCPNWLKTFRMKRQQEKRTPWCRKLPWINNAVVPCTRRWCLLRLSPYKNLRPCNFNIPAEWKYTEWSSHFAVLILPFTMVCVWVSTFIPLVRLFINYSPSNSYLHFTYRAMLLLVSISRSGTCTYWPKPADDRCP